MNKVSSLYIHLLRILAAFGVFLSHIALPHFSDWHYFKGLFGHNCVVIFFVLSGFLIAYTQAKNKKPPLEYAKDRFVRLYMVIVPALLLTYLLDSIGMRHNDTLYLQFINPEHQLFKFLINFFSIQQTLFLHSNPSSNGVFWSLSYEFWYYVFYGCLVYLQGKTKWLVLIPLMVFMGPKILILLPIWYLGVLCFRYTGKLAYSQTFFWSFFLISGCLVVAGCFHNIILWPVFGNLGAAPLFYSAYFVSDYLYGLVVFLNLLSLTHLRLDHIQVSKTLMRPTHILSTSTFPLYAMHFPLLLFVSTFFPYDRENTSSVIMVVVIIFVLCLALSLCIERTRVHYESFFMYMARKMKNLIMSKA